MTSFPRKRESILIWLFFSPPLQGEGWVGMVLLAPCLCSSFRRKPESSVFDPALRSSFESKAKASAPPAEERVTFFACAKKVTKESTPQMARPPGILPCGSASRLRGSLDAHPVHSANWRASCAPPCGLFLRRLAAPYGAPVGRHPAAEAKTQIKSLPRRRPGMAGLADPGAIAVPSIAGDGGNCPQGRAHGCARVGC